MTFSNIENVDIFKHRPARSITVILRNRKCWELVVPFMYSLRIAANRDAT